MDRFLEKASSPRDTMSALDLAMRIHQESLGWKELDRERNATCYGWKVYVEECWDSVVLYFHSQRKHWANVMDAWKKFWKLFREETFVLIISFERIATLFFSILIGTGWAAICHQWHIVLSVMTIMFQLLGTILGDIVKLINIIIGVFHSMFGFICNDLNFHKTIGFQQCFLGKCIGFSKTIGINLGGWACGLEEDMKPLSETSADSIFPFLPGMESTTCNAYESVFTLPRVLFGELLGGGLEKVIDNRIVLGVFFYLPLVLIGISCLYGIYNITNTNVYTRRTIIGLAMITANPAGRARVDLEVILSEYDVQHGKRKTLRGRDPAMPGKITPMTPLLRVRTSRWSVWLIGAMVSVIGAVVFLAVWMAVRGEDAIQDVFETLFWLFLSPKGSEFTGFSLIFCSIICFGYLVLFFALVHLFTLLLETYHSTISASIDVFYEIMLLSLFILVIPLALALRWLVWSLPHDALRGVCCRASV